MNPGDRLASVHPRKNLVTMIVAKLVVAAWQARTIAQRMLVWRLEEFALDLKGSFLNEQINSKVLAERELDHQKGCRIPARRNGQCVRA